MFPALTESRRLRLIAFTALYFAQGLPWGFISTGYVVQLTDLGLSNERIGEALALAYLPWSFKVVAGPLLDALPVTRFGRRRPVILFAEACMGLSLLSLMGVDPKTQFELLGTLLFIHNTAAALQDVAVDALAVEVLPEDERGRANSFMWAGKSAGVAVGGGGGVKVASMFGWNGLLAILAAAVLLVMLIPLFVKERPSGAPVPKPGNVFDLATLRTTFGFRTPWLGVLAGLLLPVGYALVGPVTTPLFRGKFGLSDDDIGVLSGVVDPVAGVAGAFLGGWLADRFGARKAMAGALVMVAATLGFFRFSEAWWPPSFAFLVGWTVANSMFVYAYNASSLGFYMGLSNPAVAATQFAGYMAVTNLTYAWTSKFGGKWADSHGAAWVFGVAAIAQVVVLVLLPLIDPKEAEKRYRGGPVGAVAAADRSPVG